jgi:hypothetical protein
MKTKNMKVLKNKILISTIFCLGLGLIGEMAGAQETSPIAGPAPKEIPIPRIKTSLGILPGVRELPIRKEMPDVLVMNDGQKVVNRQQWEKDGRK